MDEERGDALTEDYAHRVRHPDQDGGQGTLVVAEPQLQIDDFVNFLLTSLRAENLGKRVFFCLTNALLFFTL